MDLIHTLRRMLNTREKLLSKMSAYCDKNGISITTLGRLAVNDSRVAARIRSGGDVTTGSMDRIVHYMTAHDGTHRGRRRRGAGTT